MSSNSVTPMAYYIYALLDPRDESIYYVGQTTNLMMRFAGHKSASRNITTKSVPVNYRTNELLKAGIEPGMIILDGIITPHEYLALRLEACWQAASIQQGEHLVNVYKTGLCVDKDDPMNEIRLIKKSAFANQDQLAYLAEIDKMIAFKKVFGG